MRWTSLFRAYGLASVVTALTAASVAAQSTAASVSGTVFDEQRAVLAGATITLKHLETGQVRQTLSDQTGNFHLVGLVPGRYGMTVESAGFAPWTRPDLHLSISQDAEINPTLRVAGLAETVTVAANAPVSEVSKILPGRTFTTQDIEQLPVAGRDFANLALLTPGILTNHSTARGTVSGRVEPGDRRRVASQDVLAFSQRDPASASDQPIANRA